MGGRLPGDGFGAERTWRKEVEERRNETEAGGTAGQGVEEWTRTACPGTPRGGH